MNFYASIIYDGTSVLPGSKKYINKLLIGSEG